MRIGVDADPVGRDGSGNEVYLRNIIRALQLEGREGDELVLIGSASEALRDLVRPGTSVVANRGGIRGDLALGRLMRTARADIALAHYNAPLWFGGPVATIVHDIAYLRVPETYPRLLRQRLRLSVSRSVRVSGLIVTVSEFSRRELCDIFPRLDHTRVVVAANAAEPIFFAEPGPSALEEVRRKYSLPDVFVLAVGNVQPRKNLTRLSQAAAHVRVPLVLSGQPMWRHDEVERSLEGADVRWLGYVPRPDLAALYRLCSVFAYTSLYEGFGLPVIEAMASAAPVVTSSTTALAEVAGDAALLVDPTSTDAIAEGLQTVLVDDAVAARLRDSGPARAAEFSWSASARVLLAALRGLIARGGG